jgi:hypothetical protein
MDELKTALAAQSRVSAGQLLVGTVDTGALHMFRAGARILFQELKEKDECHYKHLQKQSV